jgi:hypothetical protein
MRLLPLLALAAAGSLQAQTRFTFTGTVSQTATQGITVGTPVTFSLVTSGNPSATLDTSSGPAYYIDYELTDVDLFQSITGTNITGSWVRPTLDGDYSEIAVNPAFNEFYGYLDILNPPRSEDYTSLSFSGIAMTSIYFSIIVDQTLASLPAQFDYDTVWSNYYGTYTINTQFTRFEFGTVDGFSTDFAITSLTIEAATPVPEPSTYGIALGALALGIAAVRRRKKA